MNRLTRNRILKFVLPPVVLLAAAISFCFLPAPLEPYKAALRAKGEKLSVRELALPVSDELVEFHRELDRLASHLVLVPIAPSEVEPLRKIPGSPGLARAMWTQPVPSPMRGATWDLFAGQMDDQEPTLREIRSLLEHIPEGGVYDGNPFLSSARVGFVARRKLCQTLAGTVINELHRKQLDAARTNLQSLMNLARSQDYEGFLVDRMIHVALVNLALSATWEALLAPGWDEARLAALQDDWRRVELVSRFAHTADLERAYSLAFYETARTNKTAAAGLNLGIRGPKGLAELVDVSVYGPIWQKVWSKGDELTFLETIQPILDGIRRGCAEGSYQKVRADFARARQLAKKRGSFFNRFRYRIANGIVPNWEKAGLTMMQTETRRCLTVTAIALKRYELKHGTMPDNLSRLVPEFLPELPRDYMNGGTLTFRLREGGRFLLYSVGENGVDDGASGDDLIWFEAVQQEATENGVKLR